MRSGCFNKHARSRLQTFKIQGVGRSGQNGGKADDAHVQVETRAQTPRVGSPVVGCGGSRDVEDKDAGLLEVPNLLPRVQAVFTVPWITARVSLSYAVQGACKGAVLGEEEST